MLSRFFSNIFFLTVFYLFTFGQQDINIKITHVPYQEPYAFLRLQFEFAGQQKVEVDDTSKIFLARSQLGFGLGLISATKSDIQLETRIGYRKVDLSNIDILPPQHVELHFGIGGRYLPRYPTFAIGRMPVRITAGLLGSLVFRGASMIDELNFDVLADAGLFFSQRDNASGILVGIQYRPMGSGAIPGAFLRPSWTMCFSFMFGPGSERHSYTE